MGWYTCSQASGNAGSVISHGQLVPRGTSSSPLRGGPLAGASRFEQKNESLS